MKNRTLAFTHSELPGYTFHIDFGNLHKLVLLLLRCEIRTSELLRAAMRKQADNRKAIYDILIKQDKPKTDEDKKYLNDKSHHNLRGCRILTEKAVKFFENLNKEAPTKPEAIRKRIRSADEKGEGEPEPIIIFANDFVEKTKQKFRAGNRFVYYAAKYLIDHNLTDGWYWETVLFDDGEKRKDFQKQINEKDDWRLSVENGHAVVGILKDKDHTGETLQVSENRSPQSFYQFLIGPRAMQYLLAFHFLDKETNDAEKINAFLAAHLKEDFDKLHSRENNYTLLDDVSTPHYLKEAPLGDEVRIYFKKIKSRIDHITKQWDYALANLQFLQRAQKNRLIMNAYRLFDEWKQKDGVIKFLRENEYNQLSICHYSLHDKEKFKNLFYSLFHLQNRMPHIPKEILDLLCNSKNLDRLMENVIKNRKKYLQEELQKFDGLPAALKKEKIIELSRKLGISVSSGLLKQNAKKALDDKRKKTMEVLPFPIHPVLVIKNFKPELYKTNYRNEKGLSRKDTNIFLLLREKVAFRRHLDIEHYDTNFADKLVISIDDDTVKAAYEKQKHKWRGILNTTLTEDILLWQIALSYMQANTYTKEMAEELKKPESGEQTVRNLHQSHLSIILNKGTGNHERDDECNHKIYIKVLFHQLDDTMYSQDKKRLRRAAVHYLNRHRKKDEREYWNANAGEEEIRRSGNTDNPESYKYSKDSGTEKNPIPYQTLRNEMELNALHAQKLADALLQWERKVIDKATMNQNSADEKQAIMKKISSKGGKFNYFNCTDYNKIKDLVELTEKEIKEIEEIREFRNRVFHNGIPLKNSFTYWARPESAIGKLLEITAPLHSKKDRSR